MIRLLLLFIAFVFCFHTASAQGSNKIIPIYKDSSTYKLVIKTMNYNGEKDIAQDNLTFKFKNGETKVYYIRYGDMLISSLTIPYSIYDRLVQFEDTVNSVHCEKESCTDSILIEIGDNSFSVSIDVLDEELVSNLMLELESDE